MDIFLMTSTIKHDTFERQTLLNVIMTKQDNHLHKSFTLMKDKNLCSRVSLSFISIHS